ncbi:MAG TPA: S8 family serine peptidase [Candidatus Limnocylindrales bacterium]
MRRSLAALAAATALLVTVGPAAGAGPEPASNPAPVIEASPPIVEPTPSAPSTPDTDPAAAGTAGSTSATDPNERRAPTDSGPAAAPRPARDPRSATDPTDRWIVVLKSGTDAAAAADRQGRRIGFAADRTFRNVLRGYSAVLDRSQVSALRHDASVAMIVADERIEAEAQTTPTGISRVNAKLSSVAHIDGIDERVDADVAIVDTGIAKVADLNVAGGYSCANTSHTAWQDNYGHGTHVAGTVGAIDNGSGVVGVAPGVRLWAVKILDDTGQGLLSWYVCGLDWIAAQHDPLDSTRPLFEVANMSVAKWGSDDRNCGNTNKDILHKAICRLVATGVTVVAAAGNDSGSAAARVPAAYNEVITVSALADTDGKPGGLGGNRCYSWGSYDRDDTFADFSNFGSDVDLIAPGKCIWSTVPGGYKYSSGTSMATPHVAGAVALLKASRPGLSPSEVREALQYLGNLGWRTSTDRDSTHERLLDVTRIGPRGDFSLTVGPNATVGEAGGTAGFPITIGRDATTFERIRLSAIDLPDGFTATFQPASLYGFAGVASTLSVTAPFGTLVGSYPITVSADEHGNVHTAIATIEIVGDAPTALPPATSTLLKGVLGSTTVPTLVSWPAASDPTTSIAGYELQTSVDGGSWSATTTTTATVRSTGASQTLGHVYQYRVRASDQVGNWSPWADGPDVTTVLVQDRASAITYTGAWTKNVYGYASGGTTTYATALGARARTTFSGRGIALVAPVGTTRGSAAIYVDGVYRGTVSFRSSTNRSRVVMYTTTFGTLGTHTIDIRLKGTGRVDIDAFVILR